MRFGHDYSKWLVLGLTPPTPRAGVTLARLWCQPGLPFRNVICETGWIFLWCVLEPATWCVGSGASWAVLQYKPRSAATVARFWTMRKELQSDLRLVVTCAGASEKLH